MSAGSRVAYRHTQVGYVTLLVMAGVLGMLLGTRRALLGGEASVRPGEWAALVIVAVSAVLFSTLTVQVDADRVTARFGPGPIRKTVPLADVVGAEVVPSRWWNGWGIRYTERGWLYNISGTGAVELTLAGGRRLRIGSDEPERLRDAVRAALSGRPQPR